MNCVSIELVMLMTTYTRELLVIRRVVMAFRTGSPFFPMRSGIDLEKLCIVIERGWRPARCCVARSAIMIVICCDVVRIRGPLVVRPMTLIAIGIRQLEVVVRMT